MKEKKRRVPILVPAVYVLIISFFLASFPTWSYAGYIAIGGNNDWETNNVNRLYPSVRIGENSSSTGQYATAIGYGAVASGNHSQAIGCAAQSLGENSIAIGCSSYVGRNESNVVSVGSSSIQRQIRWVADGSSAYDAVNYKQLSEVRAEAENKGSWKLKVDGNSARTIKNGDTVAFKSGRNISIIESGSEYAFAVADRPVFDEVTVTSGAGRITIGRGIAMDGQKITGLAAGTVDSDAVNLAQVKEMVGDKGQWTFRVNGGETGEDVIKNNDELLAIADDGKNLSISSLSDDMGNKFYQFGIADAPAFTKITVSGENGVGLDMGGTRITNLAAGVDETDAVNVKQLNDATSGLTGDFVKYDIGTQKGKVTLEGEGGTAIANLKAGAVGKDSMEAVNGSQLWETQRQIDSLDSLAVKYDDAGKNQVTLANSDGGPVKITGIASGEIAEGSTDAVNGGQLWETNQRVGALEENVENIQGDITNIKTDITNLQESDKLSVKYDGNARDKITLAGSGGTTIGNVKAGEIAEGSTEAVNGGQLYATNQNVAQNRLDIDANKADIKTLGSSTAAVLGEGFSYTVEGGVSGQFTANAGTARAKSYTDIQSAVTDALEAKWTLDVNGQETGIGNGDKFAVKDGSNINIRQDTDGAYSFNVVDNPEFKSLRVGKVDISQSGVNMGGGGITGLSPGGIYQGSSDAVTGGQLWNAYKRMDDLNEDIHIVGAHAAALSALHPVPYNPYEPTTLAAGFGTYRDEYSVAVGVFHYVRENLLVNAGMSIASDGDVMGRAGISIAVGKGSGKKPALARDMTEMQRQLADVQTALLQLREENKELREKLERK